MSEEPTEAEIHELVEAVASQLASGVPESEVVDQLVEAGWDQGEAAEVVDKVGDNVREGGIAGGGGEGMGWLAWIVILVVVNLCSWAFDWPFWLF